MSSLCLNICDLTILQWDKHKMIWLSLLPLPRYFMQPVILSTTLYSRPTERDDFLRPKGPVYYGAGPHERSFPRDERQGISWMDVKVAESCWLLGWLPGRKRPDMLPSWCPWRQAIRAFPGTYQPRCILSPATEWSYAWQLPQTQSGILKTIRFRKASMRQPIVGKACWMAIAMFTWIIVPHHLTTLIRYFILSADKSRSERQIVFGCMAESGERFSVSRENCQTGIEVIAGTIPFHRNQIFERIPIPGRKGCNLLESPFHRNYCR
jgi:hypothetical protein